MTEPVGDAGNRAQALNELAKHRGWTYLQDGYERAKKAFAAHVADELLRERDAPEINQRDIDWHRGYLAAWREILAQPNRAEQRFEKALRESERNK